MTNLKNRRLMFAACCAGMALFGFALALLGTLFGFPEMRTRLHVDLMRQGEMSSLLILGLFLSTVFAGPLIDRYGNRLVLAISSFLVAVAFAGFARVGSFLPACGAAVALGFGAGGLNTSANAAVSEIFAENRAAMLNLVGIFFGGGGLVVPLIAARVSPMTAISVAVAFAVMSGIGFLALPFPPGKEVHSFSLGDAARAIAYPGVLLLSCVLFFESANEQVMNTFTSTWADAAGASARAATLALAGYQLCMALGRIIAAPLLRVFSKERVVLAAALASVAGSAVMLSANSVRGAFLGAVLTGLFLAAIYPTVLAIAGDRYSRFSGTVFGALFAMGLIGAAIAPSAVGAIGSGLGVRYGKLVPLAGTCMVSLLTMVVARRRRRVPINRL